MTGALSSGGRDSNRRPLRWQVNAYLGWSPAQPLRMVLATVELEDPRRVLRFERRVGVGQLRQHTSPRDHGHPLGDRRRAPRVREASSQRGALQDTAGRSPALAVADRARPALVAAADPRA